jgi:hypothetical protein
MTFFPERFLVVSMWMTSFGWRQVLNCDLKMATLGAAISRSNRTFAAPVQIVQKLPFVERSIQCQKGAQHSSKGVYLGG